MKKILTLIITILLLTIGFFSNEVNACNFDTTVSDLKLDGKRILVKNRVNYIQLGKLLYEKGVEIDNDFKYIQKNKKIIEEYIKKNSYYKNNGEICEIGYIDTIKRNIEDYISDGIQTNYIVNCNSKIRDLEIRSNLFFGGNTIVDSQINMFRLIHNGKMSTNIVSIFDVSESIFYNYNIDELQYERIRKEGNDNYEKSILEDIKIININETKDDGTKEDFNNSFSEETKTIYVNNYDNIEKSFLDYISKEIKKKGNTMYLYLIFFALGFLHAVGPGHSKSLLTSLMLNKENKFNDGLKFILTFSATHYLDVFIFSIVFYYFSMNNVFFNTGIIKTASGILLFFLSIFMIYSNVKQKKCSCGHHHSHEHNHEHSHNHGNKKGNNTLIGIIAGLSPCVLGWTISTLLIATGRNDILVQSIFFLGLGSISLLFILLLIIEKLKINFFNKLEKYGKYSGIISGILLMIISLVLIYKSLSF